MSGMYYPESWMQHPEVLRLQQSNREWHQEYVKQLEEIDKLKKELHLASCALGQYIQRATRAEAKYKGVQEEVQKLKKEMEAFNNSSPFAKMFHHFVID